jgi:CubicO group peptidase (beta-lactamase class C family)
MSLTHLGAPLTRHIPNVLISSMLALCLLAPAMNSVPALAASATSYRAPADSLIDPNDLETFLDGIMAAQIQDDHIPGATISVVQNGHFLFSGGYGDADIQQGKPVSPATTLFRIGSVSKLFTWTAVMQLAEEGKVDLHADVNTYLKTFKIPATFPQPITLANLLTHTAGFEDSATDIFVPNAQALQPLGAWLATHMPVRVYPPGVVTAYSNYGAALAGYIVEQVSGMPFDQYIEQHLFKPLNMNQSTFHQPLPSNLVPNMSQGYTFVNGVYRADPFEDVQVWPAGSMSTTANDMANFMIAQLQDGRFGNTRILQTNTALEMQAQHFTLDPRLPGMAYGFYEEKINDQLLLVHAGDTNLFHALLILIPNDDVGLFVSYNSAGGATARDGLLQAFMDRYFPVSRVSTPHPLAGFNQRASQISGSYLSTRRNYTTFQKLFDLLLVVNVSPAGNGHLVISGFGGPPANVVEVAPWVFRQVYGSQQVIFHVNNSSVTMLVGNLPIEAFTKLAWYDTPAFHYLLLLVCLLLFLSALLLWPLGFLRRRLRRKHEGRQRLGASSLIHILTWVVSGLDIIFVAGLILLIINDPNGIEFSIPPALVALLILAMISSFLTIGVISSTVLIWWRHFWSRAQRIHYTLVALAALAFVVELAYWNLLGFHF